MVAGAIRGRAKTLVAVGSLTAGEVIKGQGINLAAGGHPMAEVDIRVRAITLAGAIARTAAAGSRARAGISAGDGIPMGRGRARISAVGGDNRPRVNITETT